jgi:hypothetical protein
MNFWYADDVRFVASFYSARRTSSYVYSGRMDMNRGGIKMNTVDLKMYVDTRFADLQRAEDARFQVLQQEMDSRLLAIREINEDRLELIQQELDRRLAAMEVVMNKSERIERDYLDTRMAAIVRAIEKHDADLDRRLEGMNNFREQLTVQAGRFIARDEYASFHDQVAVSMVTRTEFSFAKDQAMENVKANNEKMDMMITRAEFSVVQRLVYVGLGAILAIEVLLKFIPSLAVK